MTARHEKPRTESQEKKESEKGWVNAELSNWVQQKQQNIFILLHYLTQFVEIEKLLLLHKREERKK